MVRLGNFELTAVEILIRREGGFYVAGSLSSAGELAQLQSLVKFGRVLDFTAVDETTSVIVGSSSFSQDPIWGHRYEMLLVEYVPPGIRRAALPNGEPERVGEKFRSPRFRVVASYSHETDEIPRTGFVEYDFKIQVELVEDAEKFTVRYEDQRYPAPSRKNFHKWLERSDLRLEIYIGYLELGSLALVAKGNVEQIKSGIHKSGNWVELEGRGENRPRPQTHYYLLDNGDIVEKRFYRSSPENITARITTVLIPDIRGGDMVQAQLIDGDQATKLTVKKVEHSLSLEGCLTSLEFGSESTIR